jgi:hypothetical protein
VTLSKLYALDQVGFAVDNGTLFNSRFICCLPLHNDEDSLEESN